MSKQLRDKARFLDERRVKAALAECRSNRERLMVSLSIFAGLRAKEIAGLKWQNCEDEFLALTTTKGDRPRLVPISDNLQVAITAYKKERAGFDGPDDYVFENTHSRPGQPLTGGSVANWFHYFYNKRLGWEGFSSHSGRRTFATRIARNLGKAGGTLNDLKAMLGHSWLSTTSRYIETDPEAQRKLVNL